MSYPEWEAYDVASPESALHLSLRNYKLLHGSPVPKPAHRTPLREGYNTWQTISHELLQHVMKFMDTYHVARLTLVCKWWRSVATDAFLWTQLLVARWGNDFEVRQLFHHSVTESEATSGVVQVSQPREQPLWTEPEPTGADVRRQAWLDDERPPPSERKPGETQLGSGTSSSSSAASVAASPSRRSSNSYYSDAARSQTQTAAQRAIALPKTHPFILYGAIEAIYSNRKPTRLMRLSMAELASSPSHQWVVASDTGTRRAGVWTLERDLDSLCLPSMCQSDPMSRGVQVDGPLGHVATNDYGHVFAYRNPPRDTPSILFCDASGINVTETHASVELLQLRSGPTRVSSVWLTSSRTIDLDVVNGAEARSSSHQAWVVIGSAIFELDATHRLIRQWVVTLDVLQSLLDKRSASQADGETTAAEEESIIRTSISPFHGPFEATVELPARLSSYSNVAVLPLDVQLNDEVPWFAVVTSQYGTPLYCGLWELRKHPEAREGEGEGDDDDAEERLVQVEPLLDEEFTAFRWSSPFLVAWTATAAYVWMPSLWIAEDKSTWTFVKMIVPEGSKVSTVAVGNNVIVVACGESAHIFVLNNLEREFATHSHRVHFPSTRYTVVWAGDIQLTPDDQQLWASQQCDLLCYSTHSGKLLHRIPLLSVITSFRVNTLSLIAKTERGLFWVDFWEGSGLGWWRPRAVAESEMMLRTQFT